jgi:hypothetical protein
VNATPNPAPRTAHITILGLTFEAPQPYSTGHQCTEAEAGVLNSALAENLRNNFSRKVRAACEETKTEKALELSVPHVAELQHQFAKYAAEYTFASARPSAARLSPVDRAAHRIAADLVREKLRERGLSAVDLAEGKFDELVAQVAAREAVQAEAARRVAATQAIVDTALDIGA